MNRTYLYIVSGLVALAIICIGLFLATYAVHPGEAVLLLRGGKVAAVERGPGLRWKIPLIESVVRLDARTRLAEGRVLPAASVTSGFAVRYAAFWRIAEPKTYYRATSRDAGTVSQRLDAAVGPVIAKAMTAGGAKQFLIGARPHLDANIEAAVEPVARENGISVLGVHLGVADIPAKLADKATSTMTAGTRAEIEKAKAAGTAREAAIAAAAASSRAAVVADARLKAATITGKSEARVAAIYAPVARAAPGFFDYFLALESEGAALKTNTSVLVLSMDSPWFKTLEKTAGKRQQR